MGPRALLRELSIVCSHALTAYSRGAYFRSGAHQQSIGYLNFDQVGTNNAMARSLGFSVKVRGNERVK